MIESEFEPMSSVYGVHILLQQLFNNKTDVSHNVDLNSFNYGNTDEM